MDLFEWTQHYLRFQDVMKKNILSLEKKPFGFYVCEKNKEKTVFVASDLTDVIKKLPDSNKQHLLVVVANNIKNVDVCLRHWDELITFPLLTFVFANPQSNEKWLLRPATHHAVADAKSLQEGIYALFKQTTPY